MFNVLQFIMGPFIVVCILRTQALHFNIIAWWEKLLTYLLFASLNKYHMHFLASFVISAYYPQSQQHQKNLFVHSPCCWCKLTRHVTKLDLFYNVLSNSPQLSLNFLFFPTLFAEVTRFELRSLLFVLCRYSCLTILYIYHVSLLRFDHHFLLCSVYLSSLNVFLPGSCSHQLQSDNVKGQRRYPCRHPGNIWSSDSENGNNANDEKLFYLNCTSDLHAT